MAIALCAALTALAAESGAQDADPAYAEARSRFDEAVSAVRAGRPADAVGLFERSYAARAAPVVAVNLAYCLRGLGRLGDARRWYVRFLETATPGDLARHRETVRAHLEEISQRLARVSVGGAAPPGARLLLDDAPLAAGVRWVDPGEHRAAASAAGYVPASVAFVAHAGDLVRLSTRLTPMTTATPVTRRWWFWTAVGVAAVGVAAAVLAPLVQTSPGAYPNPQVQTP